MTIFRYTNIYKLKTVWNRLYRSLSDVGPLQSFYPNKIYFDVFRLNFRRARLTPLFYYVKEREKEAVIPLIEYRKEKIITEFAPLDYYDILSSGEELFTKRALYEVLSQYPDYLFSFNRINERSRAYKCLSSIVSEREKCVRIFLPSFGYEDYFHSLTKHQRQNIRTAYNKIEKENIQISLMKFSGGNEISTQVWRDCMRIYEQRRLSQGKIPNSIVKRLYYKISNPLEQIMKRTDNNELYVLYLNETPVAFMAGLLNKVKTEFLVPMLSCSADYLKFSTGIILINEVIKDLIRENVKSIDLGRGDEQYKYFMGGSEHINHSFKEPVSIILDLLKC